MGELRHLTVVKHEYRVEFARSFVKSSFLSIYSSYHFYQFMSIVTSWLLLLLNVLLFQLQEFHQVASSPARKMPCFPFYFIVIVFISCLTTSLLSHVLQQCNMTCPFSLTSLPSRFHDIFRTYAPAKSSGDTTSTSSWFFSNTPMGL